MGALVDFADKAQNFLQVLHSRSALIDFRIGSIHRFTLKKVEISLSKINNKINLTWHHCHIRGAWDVAELVNELQGLGIRFSEGEAQNILESGPVCLKTESKIFYRFSQLSRQEDGQVIQNDIFAITQGNNLVTIVVGDSRPPAIMRVRDEVSNDQTATRANKEDLIKDLTSPEHLLFRIFGSTCYANKNFGEAIQKEIIAFSRTYYRALPSKFLIAKIEGYEDISETIRKVCNESGNLLSELTKLGIARSLIEETQEKYNPIIGQAENEAKTISSTAERVEGRCKQNQTTLLTVAATMLAVPPIVQQLLPPAIANISSKLVGLGLLAVLGKLYWQSRPREASD